jgi:hypothetical protein
MQKTIRKKKILLFFFKLVIKFYSERYFQRYHKGLADFENGSERFEMGQKMLVGEVNKQMNTSFNLANFTDYLSDLKTKYGAKFNETPFYNTSLKVDGLKIASLKLSGSKVLLDEGGIEVKKYETLLWTATTSIFVVGGTIGALSSKYVSEKLGRKNGIIFHYIFAILGAILTLIAPYINSPECIIASRFLFGVQGG